MCTADHEYIKSLESQIDKLIEDGKDKTRRLALNALEICELESQVNKLRKALREIVFKLGASPCIGCELTGGKWSEPQKMGSCYGGHTENCPIEAARQSLAEYEGKAQQ